MRRVAGRAHRRHAAGPVRKERPTDADRDGRGADIALRASRNKDVARLRIGNRVMVGCVEEWVNHPKHRRIPEA
jgi:hypothetical protein